MQMVITNRHNYSLRQILCCLWPGQVKLTINPHKYKENHKTLAKYFLVKR